MRLLASEARYALRRLAATPLLSLGATLILALGIGSAVVMADVLERILLRAPAHVAEPDRVARVYIGRSDGPFFDRFNYEAVERLASLRDEFAATALYFTESLSLGTGENVRRVEVVAHSGAYFTALGVQPLIGSWPAPSATADDAAVISYALWQQQFGGSADVLGKALRLGLDTYSIVAVAPSGFAGIDFKAADVWLPLERRARVAYGNQWKMSAWFLQMIARLQPGVSRESAGERATAVYRATPTQSTDAKTAIVLGDLRPARAPGARMSTRVDVLVAAMSILVLLITCGNVANLLLVRGLRRDREFVVKTALGATRKRLLQEVLLEAAVLAAAAGVVALFVVTTGGKLVRQLFLSPVAALASPLDARVVLLTGLFCLVATLLLGLAPALRLTTRRALRPGQSAAVPPSRALDWFSALQIALSFPVITAAGLFVLSLWNARHQDFGMQTDRVVVVTTNLFEVGRPMENHGIHRQIEARVARLPVVESTSLIDNMVMQSRVSTIFEVPGRPLPTGPFSSEEMPGFHGVDASFFSVMRMRLVDGRFFTDDENRKDAKGVAVITESMARAYWPDTRAVGKCFKMGAGCIEVVGVAADLRLFPSIRPTRQWASAGFLPLEQASLGSQRALLVRTVGDPADALPALRREAQAASANLPYVDVHAFDDIFAVMLKPWRLGSTVFVLFGALSALIAAVGLAVVGAYAVTRRTREIGIRAALGAAPQQLVRLVLGRSFLIVVMGLGAGIGLAIACGRILAAQLFGVSATDARIFIGAVLGSLIVAAFAAWLPARRAAHIDPAIALRAE